MHPVIRIVTCISLIIVIANATWPVLAVFLFCLAGLALIVADEAISKTLQLMIRLKWLLLSIVVLYMWWTPGEPLAIAGWYIESKWWPSTQGVLYAVHRILILMLIILSVQLLLIRTSSNELIAAIDWLLKPMRWLGFSTESFALRCALTVRELSKVESSVRKSMRTMKGKSFENIASLLASVYNSAANSENEQTVSIEIPVIERPQSIQWLLPLVVFLVPVIINMFWILQ